MSIEKYAMWGFGAWFIVERVIVVRSAGHQSEKRRDRLFGTVQRCRNARHLLSDRTNGSDQILAYDHPVSMATGVVQSIERRFARRNRETGRDEFIFYAKRLMRVLIEYALSLLPFEVMIVWRFTSQIASAILHRGCRG